LVIHSQSDFRRTIVNIGTERDEDDLTVGLGCTAADGCSGDKVEQEELIESSLVDPMSSCLESNPVV
jgi:hypothetical protein